MRPRSQRRLRILERQQPTRSGHSERQSLIEKTKPDPIATIHQFNDANPCVRISPQALGLSMRRSEKFSRDQINGILEDKRQRYLTENVSFVE